MQFSEAEEVSSSFEKNFVQLYLGDSERFTFHLRDNCATMFNAQVLYGDVQYFCSRVQVVISF